MRIEAEDLRRWLRQAREGKVSRRQFVQRLLGAGLTGPFIANMLAAAAAPSSTQPQPSAFQPRHGGGDRRQLSEDQADR